MNDTKFYLLYVLTGALALSISILVYVSTDWPGWNVPNATEFESDFDSFWRDENSQTPLFIASHFVRTNFYLYTINPDLPINRKSRLKKQKR